MSSLRRVLGGAYAWLAAVFFGSVLLDVFYSSLLRDAGGASLQSVFGEASDFLLALGAPTLLAAVAATALSWGTPPAKDFFLASLLALTLEFIGPIVLFPLLGDSHNSPLPGVSAYIRLFPVGLASILSLAGFRNLYRVISSAIPGVVDPLAHSRRA
jgi:hypothetical protein